jgi:hypothetical protein
MLDPHDVIAPGALLIGLIMVGLALGRLIVWIKGAPTAANPWDAEIEHDLQQTDAVPVCHHCLTQVTPGQWFCESCGCAVGPYNNYMPYVDCFSEGEVFRNGVTDRLPRNALVVCGYMLLSFTYLIFAPVYWFFFFKNLKHVRSEANLGEGNAEKPA